MNENPPKQREKKKEIKKPAQLKKVENSIEEKRQIQKLAREQRMQARQNSKINVVKEDKEVEEEDSDEEIEFIFRNPTDDWSASSTSGSSIFGNLFGEDESWNDSSTNDDDIDERTVDNQIILDEGHEIIPNAIADDDNDGQYNYDEHGFRIENESSPEFLGWSPSASKFQKRTSKRLKKRREDIELIIDTPRRTKAQAKTIFDKGLRNTKQLLPHADPNRMFTLMEQRNIHKYDISLFEADDSS